MSPWRFFSSLTCLHALMLAFAAGHSCAAVEIQSKVISYHEGLVSASIESTLVPNPDDKAEVVVAIPGLDEVALVASGKILDATDDTIRIKIDRSPGKIVAGQMIRIHSEKPRTRSSTTSISKANPGSQASIDLRLLRKFSSPESMMTAVGFSNDNRYAITCSDGIRYWNMENGKLVKHVPLNSLVEQAVFSADRGTTLTAGEQGVMVLWNNETGSIERRFVGHRTPIQSVALSRDGQLAVSAAGSVDWPDAPPTRQTNAVQPVLRPILTDAGVRIWNRTTGHVVHVLEGHRMPVRSVAFSPNGLYLLTTSTDRTMRLWDTRTGKEAVRYVEDEPMGMVAASISSDGSRILSLSQGAPDVEELDTAPSAIVVHHSGITRQHDDQPAHRMRVWDVVAGKVIRTLVGHEHEIWCAVFSPDGKTILSASFDRTLRFWDSDKGVELAKFDLENEYANQVAFSNDGNLAIASSSDGREILILQVDQR